MLFSDLNLDERILKNIIKSGYKRATEVQELVIPIALEGKDIIGTSKTGSGKTAAFSLPIIEKILDNPWDMGLQAIILAPTRELAVQIESNIRNYARGTMVSSTTIYGGISPIRQINALKKNPKIIVATPGRLLDLITKGYIHLEDVEQIVIDEADRMLDMGMIKEVTRVITKIPNLKQRFLFSATIPGEIKKLASTYLVDPVEVSVSTPNSGATDISQRIYLVNKKDKVSLLKHYLNQTKIESCIIFARTKFRANDVNELLLELGYESDVIHSERSQSARQRTIRDLKSRKIKFLVATDIASRGIDIAELSHVINFDLPSIPETYTHRVGRTGRAGLEGVAISFCDENEKKYLREIEALLGTSISVCKDNPYKLVETGNTYEELQLKRLEREKEKRRKKNASGKKKPERRGKKGPSRKPKSKKKGVSKKK